MGVALINNALEVEGNSSGNRFSGTEYFTSLDASTSVTVGTLVVTNTMKGDRISVSGGTGDPGTLVAGDLWYRTDLGKFKFRNASTAVEMLDASTGIANPGTKATNDLLQYTGAAWDAKGAASGDRLGGTLYGSAVDLAGHLTFTADGTYDIGASGATRPRTIYAGTSVVVAGQTAMKGGDSTGGDLTGTYPSTLTVAKIQTYAVQAHLPVLGEGLVWDSSQYTPQAIWGSADKTATYSNASSGSISSLSGKMFQIVVNGRWVGGGSGGQGIFWIRPNNQSGSLYVFTSHMQGHDGGNFIHSVGTYGLGYPQTYFPIAEGVSGWDLEDMMGEILIRGESTYSNYIMIQSNFIAADGSAATTKMDGQINSGLCRDTSAVTSFYWGVTRGSFYGRITVFTYA